MKCSIESDGTPKGTIVRLENGDILENIEYIQVFLSAEENEVQLGLKNTPISIIANAEILEDGVEHEGRFVKLNMEEILKNVRGD